ncbi:hypothetical protein [Frigoriglobus tundricola]|uniref:DUF5667 domain-containing protein n=1 Tax=Frigoriglobus tundricola TaxID=2774151 RepID=A0A6M5YUA9_9BACT|nr:hypothetical protein [Frigoriglobus tundricola]QJW96996.1 hypothetical protein FTUN_4556 [Frigoriglobus tundricola]
MIRSMMVLVFFVPVITLAADDPIMAELDKARTKHTVSCDAAKTKLVTAMDAKLKEVAGKGDLDGATQIKAQKDQFEKDSTLPKAPQLTRAVMDYESEVRGAREALRKAIEKAKDGYTKALKLDEAQALATELKALGTDAKGGVDTSDDLNTKFAEGSVWKGIVKEKRGASDLTVDIVVTVTKREGPAFEGTYQGAEGKFIYEIEGAIMKDKVNFKFTKIQQPKDVKISNLIGLEQKGSIKLRPEDEEANLGDELHLAERE